MVIRKANWVLFFPIFATSFIILIQPADSSPVRTLLCCCECTEHPCPLVGPDCPNPTAPCNSTSSVRCSALQRLYEISHHETDNHIPAMEIEQAAVSIPNFDAEKPVFLLPSLDTRDVDVVKSDFLEFSTKSSRPRRRQIVEDLSKNQDTVDDENEILSRITKKMDDLELMLRFMRDEIKAHIENTKLSKQSGSVSSDVREEVDASIRPQRVRVTRNKRAAGETDNCNDEKLKELIQEHIKKDAKSSKRDIQKAANKEFGGHFNVICSPCEFSFVVSSQKYCDGFKNDVACFAFLQPPTKLKLQ